MTLAHTEVGHCGVKGRLQHDDWLSRGRCRSRLVSQQANPSLLPLHLVGGRSVLEFRDPSRVGFELGFGGVQAEAGKLGLWIGAIEGRPRRLGPVEVDLLAVELVLGIAGPRLERQRVRLIGRRAGQWAVGLF